MIPFRCLSKKITWSKCLIAPGYAMGIRAVNSQERSRKPLTVSVPVFFFCRERKREPGRLMGN